MGKELILIENFISSITLVILKLSTRNLADICDEIFVHMTYQDQQSLRNALSTIVFDINFSVPILPEQEIIEKINIILCTVFTKLKIIPLIQ